MLGYALIRLVRGLITLAAVVSFTFVMMRLTGDPARQMLPDSATPDIIADFRARWGLDRPIIEQYAIYVHNLLHLDFGQSIANGRPAMLVAIERVPATLELTGCAFLMMLLLGIPAGVVAALKRGKWGDHAFMIVSVLGHSLPNFVLGVALIYLFAVTFHVLPSSGSSTPAHLILPLVTLGISGTAIIARFTRAAVLDVLDKPYVRAAMAGGESYAATILRHVLPNAAVPLVTILGFTVGGLIAGAVIVEQVFAWPGVGRLLVDEVGLRDFSVVQALVMLFAVAMTAANFAVDIAYGLLNPRMRGGGRGNL